MPALVIILLIVGIVLLLLGVFVEAVKFLLWVGIVIVVIAVIAWLMRFISTNSYLPFVWYRILLGGVLFALLGAGVISA